jgi:ureidoacrylate peracid hydrolase
VSEETPFLQSRSLRSYALTEIKGHDHGPTTAGKYNCDTRGQLKEVRMSNAAPTVRQHVPAPPGTTQHVLLSAAPEAIELPIPQTAIIVVDMQNGYASRGGYRDLAGKDVGPAQVVIENTKKILHAARRTGLTIVYLQNGWDAELKNSGGCGSPNWYKSNPLKLMRERPELAGKILTHGTWDYAFVDGLELQAGDFVVPKARYSGFCGTDLDNILRARGIRHLVFVGIASNVCVESSIRDAYFREYFCVLVRDATQQSGPAFIHDAVIYNVETFLGWVSDTDSLCRALGHLQ